MEMLKLHQDIQEGFYSVSGVGYQLELLGVRPVLGKTRVTTMEYAKKKIHAMVMYVYVLLDLAGKLVRK